MQIPPFRKCLQCSKLFKVSQYKLRRTHGFRKFHFSILTKLQFLFILINNSDFRLSIYCSGVIPSYRETNESQLYSTSQLGFVYGRLLILQSELWDHNLFKKMWKFTRNVRLRTSRTNIGRPLVLVGQRKIWIDSI